MHLDERPNDLAIRIAQHQVPKGRVLPRDGLELFDAEFPPFLVDKAEAVQRRRQEVGLGGRVPVGVVGEVDDFRVRGVDVVAARTLAFAVAGRKCGLTPRRPSRARIVGTA
jgi:hypothetical protein